MLKITINGCPLATDQQRKHTKTGSSYLPPHVVRARKYLTAEIKKALPEKWETINSVCVASVIFCTSRNSENGVHLSEVKPDRDNMLKLLCDCATRSGVWSDDALVHFGAVATLDGCESESITMRIYSGDDVFDFCNHVWSLK